VNLLPVVVGNTEYKSIEEKMRVCGGFGFAPTIAQTQENRLGDKQRRRFWWRTLGLGLALSLVLHVILFFLATAVYHHFRPPSDQWDTIDIDLTEYTYEELMDVARRIVTRDETSDPTSVPEEPKENDELDAESSPPPD